MFLLDCTLPSIPENLAIDEAILEMAESGSDREGGNSCLVDGILRLWESSTFAVILGRSSHAMVEVNLAAARADQVPVLRRASGGSSVVIGPGCLLYSVLLSYEAYPHLRSLDLAHSFVMNRVRVSMPEMSPNVQMEGTCDLTWNGRKFSGNALRCKRSYFLYHGTILYDFDLERIPRYLMEPPRQPDYRQKRDHARFVCNIPVGVTELRNGLISAWKATAPTPPPPRDLVDHLLQEKYLSPNWHRVPDPCDQQATFRQPIV